MLTMKKILRYVAVFSALALWLGGCFPGVLQLYYQTGIVPDDYRYGDLYRLSNLPQFRNSPSDCTTVPVQSDTARTDLYIIGDSFTEPNQLRPTDLPVARFTRTHWATSKRVQLNSAHRNVLLLETVERHFRDHLREPINQLTVVADTNATRPVASWQTQLLDLYTQSHDPEPRLETVLFSSEPILRVREWKAAFTHWAFDRLDPKVKLSPDQRHLLYFLDSKPRRITSIFTPVANTNITVMVDSLNRVRERYRQLGFSEVYLSIVPNKTTIVVPMTSRYNHLIERVEQHPALRLPVVSVYAPFRSATGSIYALGDSHWNCKGRAIWLRQVRAGLRL